MTRPPAPRHAYGGGAFSGGVIEGGIRAFGGDVKILVSDAGVGAIDLHIEWR